MDQGIDGDHGLADRDPFGPIRIASHQEHRQHHAEELLRYPVDHRELTEEEFPLITYRGAAGLFDQIVDEVDQIALALIANKQEQRKCQFVETPLAQR